jgi:hypothetical protein
MMGKRLIVDGKLTQADYDSMRCDVIVQVRRPSVRPFASCLRTVLSFSPTLVTATLIILLPIALLLHSHARTI